MPVATRKTFPPGHASLLQGGAPLDALNVKDKDQVTALTHKRRAAFAAMQRAPHLNRRVIVYGDTQKLPDTTALYKTLNSDAYAEPGDARGANRWRHNTKHRVVYSEVACYYPNPANPFPIQLSTACAPNFMNSSKNDEDEFLTGGKEGRLRSGESAEKNFKPGAEKKYKDLMVLLFRRLLITQKDSDVILMPFFGGGAYLNQLSPEAKKIAQQCIHEAFREALDIEQTNLGKVKEIVYALPDEYEGGDPDRSAAYKGAETTFEGYRGPPPVSLSNANVFDVASELNRQNLGKAPPNQLRIGMVNPGSDRTIGGKYKKGMGPIDFLVRTVVPTKDNWSVPPNSPSHYVLVQGAPGIMPTELHFVDTSGPQPKFQKLEFLPPTTMANFIAYAFTNVAGISNVPDLAEEGLNYLNTHLKDHTLLAPTLEEQIFNYTDASTVQCIDQNPSGAAGFHCRLFDPNLMHDKNPSVSMAHEIEKRNFAPAEKKAIEDFAKDPKNNIAKIESISANEFKFTVKVDGEEDQHYLITPTKISCDEKADNYPLMIELACKANLNQPNLILHHPDPDELKKMQKACADHAPPIPYKVASNYEDFDRLVEAEVVNRPKTGQAKL